MSYYNIPVSTAADIPGILDVAMQLKYPVYLHGPVGVGKTSSIEAYAEEHGYHCVVRILTQTQPVDFCIPHLDHSNPTDIVVRWAVSDFLRDLPKDAPSIFVLDEINTAPPDVQAACYSLLQERRIGHFYLPDDCLVVACGNRTQDGALGEALNTGIASRVMHVQIEPDSKAWIEWALAKDIDSRVIAFLQTKPQYIHKQTLPVQEEEHVAFPSPRAWHRVSNLLRCSNNVHTFNILLSGIVGMQTAATFRATLEEIKDLRPIEDYLNFNSTELNKYAPKTIASLYGLAYGMAGYAGNNVSDIIKTIKTAVMLSDVSGNLPYQEVSLMYIGLAIRKLNSMGKAIELIQKHKQLWNEVKKYRSQIPSLEDLAR